MDDDFDLGDDEALALDVSKILRFQRVLDDPIVQRFVDAEGSEIRASAKRVMQETDPYLCDDD